MDQYIKPHMNRMGGGGGGSSAGPAADAHLRELLLLLWRRKLIIAATTVTITSLAAIYSFLAEPSYTATLQLLFESKAGPVFDFRAAAAGAPQDEAAIISEAEVVRSHSVAERVIRKLRLDEDPEFNPALRPPSWADRLVDSLLALVGGAPRSGGADPGDGQDNEGSWPPPPPLPEVATAESRAPQDPQTYAPRDPVASSSWQRAVDEFLDKLQVRQIPRSRAIEVTFTGHRPEVVAQSLNMIAETYLLARLEDRFENAKRAAGWLAERAAAMKLKVERSEKAVEDYRRRYNLLGGSRETLVAQSIAELNGKLTDAAIARRAAEANLASSRRLLLSSDKLETATPVLESSLIRRFREEELGLERRAAELGENLGPRHPVAIQMQAERKRLQEKLHAEIGKIAASLENEVQIARDRESALQRDLQGLKDEMSLANEASVGLRALEREADANRLLLEKFLTTFTETSAQEDVRSQMPDARIISSALIPEDPSFPRTGLLLAAAFLGSSVLGILFVFAAEYLDTGLRSAEELEAETGLPVIASVPQVNSLGSAKVDMASYATGNPGSAYADAVRSIYTHLLLTFKAQAPKVVLLTSAQPGEGKTTLAVSLARQQALAGRRVMLLDADFRRSRVGKLTGAALAPGLSELLAQLASRSEAIQRDPGSPADLLVAGKQPMMNFAIGNTDRLGLLLTELRSEYDLIVIDSAPVLALADVRVVAAMADVTLMVVRWGSTQRRVLRYAVSQIAGVGGDLHGLILSMVNIKQRAQYGYGDAAHYSGRLRQYYTE